MARNMVQRQRQRRRHGVVAKIAREEVISLEWQGNNVLRVNWRFGTIFKEEDMLSRLIVCCLRRREWRLG